MILRTGTVVAGTPQVTGLKRTADLTAGMRLYANAGIAVEAVIKTIDSPTQITMDRLAVGSYTENIQFSNADVGVFLERSYALYDTWNEIQQRGEIIQFIEREETDVVRDNYNSINRRLQNTKFFLRSYPIEYAPAEERLERAGLKEECDVVAYTSMLDWINNGYDVNDIDKIRSTIKIQGNTYKIRNIGLVSQFADTFLYVTIALVRG